MLPVLGLAAVAVVMAWIAARPTVDLRRLDLSGLRTSPGQQRIGRFLAVGFAAGLVGGVMLALMSTVVGFVGRLMVTFEFGALGIVSALMVGLFSGPTTHPTAIDRPARLVQQGTVYPIAAMVAVPLALLLAGMLGNRLSAGVVGMLVAGLGTGVAIGLVIGPAGGLAAGLAVGLNSNPHIVGLPFTVVAPVVGLIFAANPPWPRYLFATMLLARRGDLPRRPAVFLDWAYQAGLMRLSGIAVQFRHREFQTWLTTRDQRGGPARPSRGNKG